MEKQIFEIEGYMVESSSATFLLAIGNYMFEFSQDDLLEVVNLSVPDGVEITKSLPVRVKLNSPASLLDAYLIDPLQHISAFGILPFSLAVRSETVQALDCSKFKELEKAFLKKHDL